EGGQHGGRRVRVGPVVERQRHVAGIAHAGKGGKEPGAQWADKCERRRRVHDERGSGAGRGDRRRPHVSSVSGATARWPLSTELSSSVSVRSMVRESLWRPSTTYTLPACTDGVAARAGTMRFTSTTRSWAS